MADWNVARAIAVLRLANSSDAYFVRTCLLSAPIQHLMHAWSTTTVQATLNLKEIRQIPLPWPDADERKKIAEVIGALDDKIELNRQTNETLEAMTRALFKSWFVDFDPVRAKSEGRDTGLPKDIDVLFSDSFEDSELGEIPKGWRYLPFADTVDIIGGGTPKTSNLEYWNGTIPWFSVVDASKESDIWVVDTAKKITYEGLASSSARVLEVGTTIISARGTVGRVCLVGTPMTINQSCYGLKCKVGGKGYFTYFATRNLVVTLKQIAHGAVFDTITRDTFATVRIAEPPPELLNEFERSVDAMMLRVRGSMIESRSLSSIRDSLLPKLISGEIRLHANAREAEESF